MSDKIQCPNCGHNFDVEQALAGKLEAQLQAEFEKKTAAQAEIFRAKREEQEARNKKQRDELEKAQAEFERKREKENELFKEKLNKRLEQESVRIDKEKQEQYEQQMKALQADVEKRKAENRELKQQELDLLKRENELKERQEELRLELEKKMLERQQKIEEKARAKEREAMLLKEKEWEKKLDDQKKLIDEMKRKAEQGSMQMQGEVQELALEELLGLTYPFDRIDEVIKGARGADCIQTVVNERQQECGSIIYESKRTKNFSNDWINKLKQDQVQSKADIAVIVTETFPKGMQRFDKIDGVWVCGFHEVKSLSLALRETLVKMHTVKSVEENKGDKMELLYNYLTSNEFVQNINRIVENYDGMMSQLNTEKKAMMRMWKQREKQIWVTQENIASLFGSIKGIAGNALSTSAVLELPEYDENE